MNDAIQKANFSLLHDDEKRKRIRQLVNNNTIIKVWEKGKTERDFYKAVRLHNKNKEIFLEKIDNSSLINKKVLINFEIGGMQFFTSGKVVEKNKIIRLINFKKIFKCERRKSYRLLTYPIHQAKLIIPVKNNENVHNLNAKKTGKTNLFKSFLRLVNNVSDESVEQIISTRLQNLSTSGASFIVSELESGCFKEGKTLKNVTLDFNGEEYEIPKMKIIYVLDYVEVNKAGVSSFKIGVKFADIDFDLDYQLSRHLKREIKEEDFSKMFETLE